MYRHFLKNEYAKEENKKPIKHVQIKSTRMKNNK